MKETTLVALLGRPLTPVETENRTMYLKIVNDVLEGLICSPTHRVTEPRTFDTRKGYRTAFTDIFTDVIEVKIDDEVIDSSKYSMRQRDKRKADWYNSLVFNDKFDNNEDIVVEADWGFECMPRDLQAVVAGLFDQITKKNKSDASIASKQVEDFRVTFNNEIDIDEIFYAKYGNTISKYSQCDVPNVQHGDVC